MDVLKTIKTFVRAHLNILYKKIERASRSITGGVRSWQSEGYVVNMQICTVYLCEGEKRRGEESGERGRGATTTILAHHYTLNLLPQSLHVHGCPSPLPISSPLPHAKPLPWLQQQSRARRQPSPSPLSHPCSILSCPEPYSNPPTPLTIAYIVGHGLLP